MKPKFLLTGARIIPVDGTANVLNGVDIWIADGRIAALSPRGSSPPYEGDYKTLTFDNSLIIPGLVNAHSHSTSALQRGRTAGAPLDLYVLEIMSRRSRRSTQQVRISVLLHAIEMLKNGITAVVDHFRDGAVPSVEAVSTVFQAYDDVGMRANVAPMFEDRRYIDSLPIDQARLPAAIQQHWRAVTPPSADQYFAMMEEVATDWRDRERLSLMLGVEGPQRCTPRLLERAGEFAERHDVGLHTHLLEAKTQALMAPEFGGSFVAYLDRFGLISPKSSLAHFVWCSDQDIEIAAEKRVNVVNNPVSNLLLGSGLQPTGRLLEAGIAVGLGSDGSSGNPSNVLEQAKFSMLLSRISQLDCDRWITAQQAIWMATAGGGAVLGEPESRGAIRVGAHADLAILNLASRLHCPLGDIWNHLVMFENGQSVDTVFVGGELVLLNGRCTKMNEDDIYAEAATLAAREYSENVPHLAAAREERPAFQSLIVKSLKQDLAIDRFARLD